MNKILIPTDFTDQSLTILDYGIELAYSMNYGVMLYFYLDISRYNAPYFNFELSEMPYDLNDYAEVFENVGRRCSKYISDIKEKYSKDFPIDYKTGSGWFADLVIDMARDKEVDMVLLGGKKNYGFLDRFINHTDTLIVDSVPCPVWVIPRGFIFKPIKKITYPTDYNKIHIPFLKHLSRLAGIFDASLHVLNITNDKLFHDQIKQVEYKESIRKECDYNNIEFHVMEGEGTIDRIDRFVDEEEADLIVMLKENRGFLEKLFSKHVSRKLIFRTDLPVLVLRENETLFNTLPSQNFRRAET